MRLCAASPSFGGANHLFTQTTRVVTFGFTLCAPSVNESMLRMTSGIGIDPTTPRGFVFVIAPATTPAMYAPSYVRESYVLMLDAVLYPVACSNFTPLASAATLSIGSMYPKVVPKI